MKKTAITFAISAFAITTAHAQLHSRSESFVGVKAGGSAASFEGAQAKNLRYVFGFNAGVFANLALYKPFSLQPEILYSMKGRQGPYDISNDQVKLAYLDIPVALRANMEDLYVEAGPQAGFLLTAKSDATGETVNVRDAYRTVDFGYVLGAGYQPQRGGLGIGARYNGGFLSTLKDPATGANAPAIRNSVFQLFLTYSPKAPTKHKKHK